MLVTVKLYTLKKVDKMKLTYNETKELLKLTDRDAVEAFINGNDFYNTNYAIYSEDEALKEVSNMYEGDAYMLGCFNADFIDDFIALDYEDIKTLQDGEQFEIIGKLIMNSGNFEAMMKEYIRLDGYGNALSSYDGNYNEVRINNEDYIVIRVN